MCHSRRTSACFMTRTFELPGAKDKRLGTRRMNKQHKKDRKERSTKIEPISELSGLPLNSPQNDLNDLAATLSRAFRTNSSADAPQLPKRVQPLFRRLNARGKSLMAVADILNECRSVGGFMKNKFVDTLLFLDEFQIRDAAERQSFFVQLNSNLELFPDDISRNKILPKLIHTYEYGDAGAHILVPMFKLGRLLEETEYQQRVVPCLVKLFSSTDRTTRVKLLERIDEFAGHLRPQVTIVAFADKLNHNNLNTDLMKHLARLQGSDPEPSIRTNTTICLGKIGCFIDPSHRQRILISAFTRALKDPFPPARMAGVIALSATQQYYSLAEVAQRILPSLTPLAVDPDKQKASENPELIPELEAQVKAGGKGGLLSGDKVPQWAGWAIKAISGKFYKSSSPAPPVQAVQQQQQQSQQDEAAAKSVTEESEKERPVETKRKVAQPTAFPRVGSFSSSHSSASARGTNSSVTDGWGELVDEEEDEATPKARDGGAGGGDALWGAGLDDWEAGETPAAAATTPKTDTLRNVKLNPPGTTTTTILPTTSSSSSLAMPVKSTNGKASLKLGAIKNSSDKTKASEDLLNLLLDLKTEECATDKSPNKNVFGKMKETTQPPNKAAENSGNFASVATQLAQQRREQQKKEQRTEAKGTAEVPSLNDWQSW
uniref:Protein kinase domain-containing protein n=1 Tax=Globodera pallida TaxID=36090 RepID=A0A183BLN9_GLOPA